jgi:hypothetical protein
MWRHGDVLIQACAEIPTEAARLPHLILAKGELTGHAHRIEESDAAQLFRHGEKMYLRVTGERASVTHQEHATISLGRGMYRVWIQREYTPERIRKVVD